MLAAQAAIAIRNARLHEQTLKDAETKATLLHEVNHRVRNNLTSIIGLLSLEQERTNVDQVAYQAVMEDLSSRIQGLATVHRMLSDAEWSSLPLSQVAELVIGSTLRALVSDKRVSAKVSPSLVQVTPKYANNLALVFNELTTNSVKYAWPVASTGHIDVRIERQERDGEQDGEILIEFRDDGVGYPDQVLRLEHHSVGWDLIETIVCYGMAGEVILQNEQGAMTIIRFPILD
ncbi:MAG: sensor histidine kinase [Chloroflexi bacterium]|nr:sensor histidine kinase [Chloroflexota bacterium]